MQSFALFQIIPTREMHEHINKHGWGALDDIPAFAAAQELSVKGHDAFVVTHSVFFDHVATIDAEDLEDAFRVGNMGPDCQIERHARMHSPSVGDVLVDLETGRSFMIDPFGHSRVNFNTNMAGGLAC